ncbi:Hypothetical protein CINCED_3A000606 [Cinara cedri]|uniref:Uncharacterized protein n=1 Tax=Cinara cedri TaxID=506608 RepID=A0A5E4NJT7_9HEMI|nr:Hypothetical protein CINCED_3A000606 [Cinara cedri]
MHGEVRQRINMGNRAYFAIKKMVSRKTKEVLYICYLRPIVMCACKTEPWPMTKSDDYNILKEIDIKKDKKNSSAGDYERWKNVELEQLYNKPSIKNMWHAKRLDRVGHMW